MAETQGKFLIMRSISTGTQTMMSEVFEGTWAQAVQYSCKFAFPDWVESRRELRDEGKYLSRGFYDDLHNASYVLTVKRID